ncbi:MAG: hypothetical protein Q8N47_02940 [Bryobacterales bacterium]|nr:hypothetical protein [Bryobacterales bacterium]
MIKTGPQARENHMRRSLALVLLLSLPIDVSTAAEPLNILNNGGFEYGLMCYGNWIWSQTGQDYKGDYQFLLSTDAHSGSYSVEIRCAGTDCEKAAIQPRIIQGTSKHRQMAMFTVFSDRLMSPR